MVNELLSGSYSKDDVIFLLKEITGLITEMNNEYRENAIQSGIHYSEMLPIEYHPTEEYMKIFYETLEQSKTKIAYLVSVVSDKIIKKQGTDIILISLARAGTPIGILIKRYLKFKYKFDLSHYSISIIRDKGIDKNALAYILKNHPYKTFQFIDGWTGKGVIQDTLIKACDDFFAEHKIKLNSDLAVLSDPAYCCRTYGTREDFLIPSACLNATVSGLMSRTVLNEKFISKEDFHGAKFYKDWTSMDVSNFFIDTISDQFKYINDYKDKALLSTYNYSENNDEKISHNVLEDIKNIMSIYDIKNINLIKPGVGETTRVLLRRIPRKILVNSMDNINLRHIYKLSEDRKVPVEIFKDMTYSCCGLIKPKEASDL